MLKVFSISSTLWKSKISTWSSLVLFVIPWKRFDILLKTRFNAIRQRKSLEIFLVLKKAHHDRVFFFCLPRTPSFFFAALLWIINSFKNNRKTPHTYTRWWAALCNVLVRLSCARDVKREWHRDIMRLFLLSCTHSLPSTWKMWKTLNFLFF